MDAADLATPGTAVAIAEHAAAADLLLQTVGGLVTEVQAWLLDCSDRVEVAADRSARYLTAGAAVATALSLFLAGLSVLLFHQGRRLSRR
jgi:hypothetical protein